ncbi:MAG: PLP-dependent aminotransferase family protein [Opitutaceae bacterium]|nr:PLP-dependent aminotransferase family protein [Opitutaceae bacterium]
MSPATTPSQGRASLAFATRTSGMKPSAIREILKVTESPEIISFAGGLPAPELFPVESAMMAAAVVLGGDGAAALQYSTTEGHRPLREWVTRHLVDWVGLSADPGRVVITHGSQQGLDLLGKVLLDPGDVVLTENPAYLGALQAFGAYEANIVGVASDSEGIRPEALREAIDRAPRRPKFLYLIPNFQNPTGTSLSADRRLGVMRVAAEHGLLVVEDDPYGRLRFEGMPQPALVASAGDVPWVYLGTTSKILAPGLRVAWFVSSERSIIEKVVTAKQATDLHTSTFTQRLAYECVKVPGALEQHVARLCEVYSRRRDLMLAALATHMPEGCTWTRPEGGLFLWVTLPDRLDSLQLLHEAMKAKVAFVPGESFWIGEPRRNTLRLNFSNANEAQIGEGIARLGAVVGAAMAR